MYSYGPSVGSPANGGGELYFTPNASVRMHWPICDEAQLGSITRRRLHGLYATLGTGPVLHERQPEHRDLFSFDLNISDNLTINFHERLSLPQYSYYAGAYSDPSYSGYANTYALYNSAGAAAVWSVNKVPLRAGYEHVNTLYLNSGNAYAPDSPTRHGLIPHGGYELKPRRVVGLETGMSMLSYGQASAATAPSGYNNYPNRHPIHFWSFYNDQFTEHISGALHAGYMIFSSDMPVSSAFNSGGGGLYFMVVSFPTN